MTVRFWQGLLPLACTSSVCSAATKAGHRPRHFSTIMLAGLHPSACGR
jgi:hypothetical protein